MNIQSLFMCRVSSPEQKDGQSLTSQEKLGERYIQQKSLHVVKRWVLDETASKPNERKFFNEMVNYAKKHPEIKVLLFEKPDRLTRNVADLAKAHELVLIHGKELHFFRTGLIINRDSSEDDWIHFNQDCIDAVKFIHRLRAETRKGVVEKIEQGWFPGLAPCGYKNDTIKNTIVLFEETARWVTRAFQLMRSGLYTLEAGRAKLLAEGCPERLLPHRSGLEKWIRNSFYYGSFIWAGKLYSGKHPALVSKQTWDEANAALSAGGKVIVPQGYPYTKLITCSVCGCMITAEGHKGRRFIYYRCARSKGRCGNDDYVPQQMIEDQLLGLLRAVQIDDEFADWTLEALSFDAADSTARKISTLAVLQQQLQKVLNRRKASRLDKLDEKITEDEWITETRAFDDEARRIESNIGHLEVATPSSYLPTARRFLALPKRLPELFFSMKPENRRHVVTVVSLNPTMTGKTITTTYQTPWCYIPKKAEKENWGDRGDLNPRPPRSQRGALTS
jgi:site-specific DNA recombinase